MRAALLLLLVAVSAACVPLAAQQELRVVRGLSFRGNRALDNYALRTAIATTSSSYFASAWWLRWIGLGEKRYFDELEFRRDVVRLYLLYRQSGYMDAVIDTVVRRTARDVFVTFRIYEGEPVRVGRLAIVGVDPVVNAAPLRSELPLHVGDPFNRLLFLASSDTVVSRLRNVGYPYADVFRSFDVVDSTRRADLQLEVVPGRRMRVAAVAIEGAARVNSSTIRRMLSIKPRDLFRQDQLYQSQRDLYGMGVFRSATVLLVDSLPPGPADSTVRVLVRVQEGPRHGIRLGAGFGSIDCFRVQGGWTAYDFLGGGRALELTGQLSKLGLGAPTEAGGLKDFCAALQRNFLKGNRAPDSLVNYNAATTLRQPAFLSPRHTASLGVFAERRSEFQVYTRQAVGLNVGVTLNARRRLPVTLGYGYSVGHTTADAASYCSVFRLCNSADQDFLAKSRRFAALTASAVRDNANSVLDPSRGSVGTVLLTHASRFVGSDSLYEFNRGELDVSHYYPIGRRTVFAWRLRTGTVLQQRKRLAGQGVRFVPPDQRFYAGGPNSVRGYGRNELGPRVYVTDSLQLSGTDTTIVADQVRAAPTGGNAMFVVNAELRLPTPVFPERMRVGVFVDVGQVWERNAELATVRGLRVTPGAGVRFATPLGPVRLDAAYNGYGSESGPLYFQDNATGTLTLIRPSYPPSQESKTFWQRIVVQFAVGQAF